MARERELKVKILGDSKGAEKALDRTAKASGKLDSALEKTNKVSGGLGGTLKDNLSVGAAAGGVALVALANQAVNAASDLGEQVSATEQVFGDASEAVLKFGDDAAESLGISNRAALEAANQFGDLFQNVGISQGNAAQFSEQLVRLAADLASFKNLDPGDVLQRLQSGLVGETEPLRRLGVVINEAAVKAKAMELGIAGVSGEVSEGAKVQARYALILEKTERAQGDVARTSDSLANQQRRANAQMEDANARFGRVLIPLYQQAALAASSLAGGVDEVNDSFIRNFPLLSKIAEKLGFLKKEADPAAVAYKQLTAEVAKQAEQTETQAAAEKRTADAMRDSTSAVRGYESALRDLFRASEGLIGSQFAVEDAERAVVDSHQDVIDAERALAEARAGNGSGAEAAARAAQALADAQRDAGRAAADAAEDVAEAERAYNDAIAKAPGGSADAEEAAKRLAEARQKQARSAEDASRRVADAERGTTGTGSRADDIREAAERLAQARRDELRDINDLARTRRDLAAQQAEAAGKTLSDADKYRIYRDELIKLKDTIAPGSELRRNLEGLIKDLPAPEHKFTIIADTTQADEALESLRQKYLAFNQANPGAVGPSLFGPVGAPPTGQAPAVSITVNGQVDRYDEARITAAVRAGMDPWWSRVQ